MSTYIKTTMDGRKVEVIDRAICLDGKAETDGLVPVIMHPNWRTIVEVAPEATHMAGRLALTVDEAEMAQRALDRQREEYAKSPLGIAEAQRRAINDMLLKRSDE